MKTKTLIAALLLAGPLALPSTSMAATISTDKDTYYLYNTVVISGTGFTPGDIELTVARPDGQTETISAVQADGDGCFTAYYLLDCDSSFDGTYTVTATDLAGQSATDTFVDPKTPTTTTLDPIPALTPGQTGVAWSGQVTPSSGTVPAGLTVQLQMDGGTIANTTTQSGGAFSGTFTAPTTTGSHTFAAHFLGSGSSTGFAGSFSLDQSVTVQAPDSTPPQITPNVSGTLGNNGWYTGDVTVSWTVTDPESIITSVSGNETTVISTDTTGTDLTCSATSAGGTNSVTVTIKRDATPPTITASRTPAANSYGWNNGTITASYTASDATSGLASSSPATGSFDFTDEGAGQSHTFTVYDDAGNQASATIQDVNIDLTKPTVTISAAGPYILGSTASATWTASDALSGIAGDLTGTVPIDTTSIGTGLTVNAPTVYDKAGNSSAAASATYSVIYGFAGFQSPWAEGRAFKLGSTIPLKWCYTDASGTPVPSPSPTTGPFAGALPEVRVTYMGSVTTSESPVPEDSGQSGYQYDPVTKTWQFNWQTKGRSVGTYNVTVRCPWTGQTDGPLSVVLKK